ncbi:MAG: AmmeMemoRadiSam system radical SAM enzyme [Planctomycetota bacterium]
MREALLYHREGPVLVCDLCAHRCQVDDGGRGICQVRENQGGVLYTLVFDRVRACRIGPIELKPLYHFLPGSLSCSVAAMGCNFHCLYCETAEISQVGEGGAISGGLLRADEIVERAAAMGCRSITYTYSEPTVFLELALSIAKHACERGLRNVFFTNGYMTKEAIDLLTPVLHAANVDLKGFSDECYQRDYGGKLAPVLRTIEAMKSTGVWIEITTVLIPGKNDSDAELRELARFIASVDAGIPWHISSFNPAHQLCDWPRTSPARLEAAIDIGRRAGLRFVYSGGAGHEAESTLCPSCGSLLVDRFAGNLCSNRVVHGGCPRCGRKVEGLWD